MFWGLGEASSGYGGIYLCSNTKTVNENDKIMLAYTSLYQRLALGYLHPKMGSKTSINLHNIGKSAALQISKNTFGYQTTLVMVSAP